MNTKTKIMLGLSVLTAGTLAAGATGTFAWFTTNKTAKATYSKIVATADTQKIKVVIGGVTDNGIATGTNYDSTTDTWSTEAKSGTSANSFTGDVSSADGLKLVKPQWVTSAANDAPVYGIRDAKTTEYTQYYVALTNTGTSSVKVFLNQNTTITATTADKNEDEALAKWTRVAVVETTLTAAPTTVQSTGTLKALFENDVTGALKSKYVSGVTAGTDETTLTVSDLPTASESVHQVGKYSTVTSSTATTVKGYLGELAKDETKYYVVSVWMEGTEADNQDAAEGGAIDVTLGFTGIE